MDYKYLNNIEYPADLRKLPVEVLPDVCSELRDDIVKELSVNPGHLASSLGVTELTVALHYVYDTPEDRIVWDVGHQAYGHKILTGRRDTFCTNRKLGGLHPFPCPSESEYDTFTCGHASNSISAALGMAIAAKLKMENGKWKIENGKWKIDSSTDSLKKRHVVAVIGDGAMSGGLAFEGLNNVSSSPNDLLIILNDNNMSIDRSVGGMKQYLLSLNTNESYNKWRNNIAGWMRGHGWLDENRRKKTIRLGNALKAALSSQANVFEGMNIRYFGPVDGHDVKELVRVLRQLKDMKGPKLLHIHTIKGKGYRPAEEHATVWHAPGKFNPETGERLEEASMKMENGKWRMENGKLAVPLPPKYQDVFGETLVELAQQNAKIVGVTPAMPTGCSMNKLMAVMPDRAFDVGIAEGHAVTFSGGMAKEGLIPFCNIYSAFAQRAYDNIIHDVAIEGLHVVFCLDRAGIVGEDGATHHGAFDMAALRPIPNLTICAPMNEHELRKMMYTSSMHNSQCTMHNSQCTMPNSEVGGPWVIRYPRGRGVLTDWRCPLEEIPVGKGRKLRDGKDVAVISIGHIGNNVAEAIEKMENGEWKMENGKCKMENGEWRMENGEWKMENGECKMENGEFSVAHYDMRFLKPIDTEILDEVGRNYKYVITVEDGVKDGGLGSAVLEYFADHGYTPRVKRLGMPSDTFVEHGTVAELQHIVGIDVEGIKKAISCLVV